TSLSTIYSSLVPIRRPPRPPPVPYTTLFRSTTGANSPNTTLPLGMSHSRPETRRLRLRPAGTLILTVRLITSRLPSVADLRPGRSEEHTSELQSRSDLVCRLLLEKKNLIVIR